VRSSPRVGKTLVYGRFSVNTSPQAPRTKVRAFSSRKEQSSRNSSSFVQPQLKTDQMRDKDAEENMSSVYRLFLVLARRTTSLLGLPRSR